MKGCNGYPQGARRGGAGSTKGLQVRCKTQGRSCREKERDGGVEVVAAWHLSLSLALSRRCHQQNCSLLCDLFPKGGSFLLAFSPCISSASTPSCAAAMLLCDPANHCVSRLGMLKTLPSLEVSLAPHLLTFQLIKDVWP